MGLVKGLKGIKDYTDAQEAKFSKRDNDGPKSRWFKIEDKKTVKVLFLQELDPDAPNYSEKNGLGTLAVEHQHPKNFKKKALCTIDDEGVCWACEQHDKDYKVGWKQRTKLYINVLVDDGEQDPYVAILSQGFGARSITPVLLEFAQEEDASITDKWFKIKRNGAKLDDTSYILMPSVASKENVEDYELFDFERVLMSVPYEKQEAYYLDGEVTEEEVTETAKQETSKDTDEDSW